VSGPEGRGGASAASGKIRRPAQLLSQLLLTFLDSFCLLLGRLPQGADATKRLIRLVLVGFPPPAALAMSAAAVVGLSQVSVPRTLTPPGKKTKP
jgi:hypothetical protein